MLIGQQNQQKGQNGAVPTSIMQVELHEYNYSHILMSSLDDSQVPGSESVGGCRNHLFIGVSSETRLLANRGQTEIL